MAASVFGSAGLVLQDANVTLARTTSTVLIRRVMVVNVNHEGGTRVSWIARITVFRRLISATLAFLARVGHVSTRLVRHFPAVFHGRSNPALSAFQSAKPRSK